MLNRINAFFGASIRIGLSSRAIAIVQQAPWGGKGTILANHILHVDLASAQQPGAICAQLIPQIQAHCSTTFASGACAGLPLHFTLSDDLVRLFMVTPPQNSARLHDIKAAAAMRFQMLYGDPIGDLQGDWCMEADWHASKPFLAGAIPRAMINGVGEMAKRHGLFVQAIEPNFVAAWNGANGRIAKGAWFGVVHEDHLTLAAVGQNSLHIEGVRSLTIPPDGHGLNWLEEQLARAVLQLDVPVPAQLCLAGNRAQFWSDQRQKASQSTTSGAKLDALVITNLDQGPAIAGDTTSSAAVMLARKGQRA